MKAFGKNQSVCFLILLTVFSYSTLSAQNISKDQKMKYDDPIVILTKYPPIPNPPYQKFDSILNHNLVIKYNIDSSFRIYLCVVVNRNGVADFDYGLDKNRGGDESIRLKIIDILKSNCSWTPGKTGDTEKVVWTQVENKKIKQKETVPLNVDYQLWLVFEIKKNQIKMIK